ncbi:hypothetical protein CLOSTMETH_00040 [[Clostridium] methylpentosum DSM 5476]|uniref:Uncharacterized protein n=1 Tax=[Clostridium] methylpentosum DSM 5476 TaxID=537013 RepID=C0E868_9FIRM|nr:hypothetical protein CLOSTMETH_00040 [[Clostridium] methylpentosum DSM 5476]
MNPIIPEIASSVNPKANPSFILLSSQLIDAILYHPVFPMWRSAQIQKCTGSAPPSPILRVLQRVCCGCAILL